MSQNKKYDKPIAFLFFALTIGFIILAMTNKTVFNWVYERHQNQLSWYIRPIFLIPFCYFAYKRLWTGIAITLFALFTSMCWFPKPDEVSENVRSFLEQEKSWLSGDWDIKKILLTLTIPFSLFALGLAFWKKSLLIGLAVIVLIATAKVVWSIQGAGEAGKSIVLPAVVGLIVCVFLIYFGFKRLERKSKR